MRKIARATWNVTRWFLLSTGMLLVLWSCNSHPMSTETFGHVWSEEPDASTASGRTMSATTTASSSARNPFASGGSVGTGGATASGSMVVMGGIEATGGMEATGGDTAVPAGGTTSIATTSPTGGQAGHDAAVPPPDARPPSPDLPPDVSVETYSCPPGTVRIHVRDIWSSTVNPTMNTMTAPPLSVLIIDPTGSWPEYGARQDTANCSWYSVCAPNTLTKFQIKPVGADACGGTSNSSGTFDASKLVPASNEIWLDYTARPAPWPPTTPTPPSAPSISASPTTRLWSPPKRARKGSPIRSVPSGYIKVHFRWPWGDPQETGFPGSGCGKIKLGYARPPTPAA